MRSIRVKAERNEPARAVNYPGKAVRECADLSDLFRRRHRVAGVVIDFDMIIGTLLKKKIPFVLTGAHGISTWTGRPRSTQDVDILVKPGRNYARELRAVQGLYPRLETRLLPGVAALFVPGEKESVIDVIYPHRLDLARTLETSLWIEDRGKRYRIPALEAALANKYGASLALNRDAGKRAQDMVDFYTMVRHSLDEGRTPIDMEELAEMGELVWPGRRRGNRPIRGTGQSRRSAEAKVAGIIRNRTVFRRAKLGADCGLPTSGIFLQRNKFGDGAP
jgi:hypothetical protein